MTPLTIKYSAIQNKNHHLVTVAVAYCQVLKDWHRKKNLCFSRFFKLPPWKIHDTFFAKGQWFSVLQKGLSMTATATLNPVSPTRNHQITKSILQTNFLIQGGAKAYETVGREATFKWVEIQVEAPWVAALLTAGYKLEVEPRITPGPQRPILSEAIPFIYKKAKVEH